MTTSIALRWRTTVEPWLVGLLLGALVGLVVLGVGSRIAMRAIAIANSTPTGFTVGGTATVVFLGVVSGVGGGLLYAFLHRFIPRPRFVRSALYATAIALLTLRGLRPIQPLALEWFMPLALGYGAIIDVGYTKWLRQRVATTTRRAAAVAPSDYPGGA